MRRVFLLLTLTLVLLVGCSQGPRPQPTATTGATYTVAPGGNDSAGCGGTMRTINAGMACLSAGDTLYVRSGTYNEGLDNFAGTPWHSGTSWDNPVTIAGHPDDPPRSAIIQPTSMSSGWLVGIYQPGGSVQFIILDNLTFSETRSGVARLMDIGPGSANIRISNSLITGTMGDGAPDQNGILTGAPGAQILNNEIRNVSGYGIYFPASNGLIDGNYIHHTGGYGIHHHDEACPTGSNNNIIRNNRIDNNGQVTGGGGGYPGCGMVTGSGNNNQVYNNVVTNQQHTACGIQVYGSSVRASITHNTITGNGGACIDVNPGAQGTTVCDNACQRNGGGIVDSGRNTELCHNWFEAGPIPEGYGARGVVTGPSATGRSYSTAP
jgi:hypothetical protein